MPTAVQSGTFTGMPMAAKQLQWFGSVGIAVVLYGCHNPNPPEETLSNAVPKGSATDYALSFDGLNDYATLGTARFPVPTLAQSITLWMRPDGFAGVADLLTLRRDDSGNELGLSASGFVTMWRIWGLETLVEATVPLVTGQWHHIAYVYDTSQSELYVDGLLTGTGSTNPNNHSPTSGWLGSYNGMERFYSGSMDELRVWAVARTLAEIEAEYNGEAPTSDPDLVGYYSFNEDEGARAYDRSGNGNHVTLGDGIAEYMPARRVSDRR